MNIQFTAVSFSTHPLHESAYELKLDFSSQESSFARTFTFLETSPKEGRVQDIFTKNGVCQNYKPSKPLTRKEQGEAEAALPLINPAYQTVAVFDFNDLENRYRYQDSIAATEKSVLNLFQEGQLKMIPANFLLFEGSLKHDILKQLSETEIAFLNSKPGAKAFCECAEYFMNGMKLGGSPRDFDPHKYIIGVKNERYKPVQISTVFYPEQYKTVYSVDSAFSMALKPVFQVSGNYDPSNKITTLHVRRK